MLIELSQTLNQAHDTLKKDLSAPTQSAALELYNSREKSQDILNVKGELFVLFLKSDLPEFFEFSENEIVKLAIFAFQALLIEEPDFDVFGFDECIEESIVAAVEKILHRKTFGSNPDFSP